MKRMITGLVAACVALPVLALAGMIVFGTSAAPPPLASVYDAVAAMDFSGAPEEKSFTARDGARLAYRAYPGSGPAIVLIHGSTGNSLSVHMLAKARNARGFAVYAPDMRGHGNSGVRGDIRYAGQLEDDLADMVAALGVKAPALVGFSAGGGFALRVAGGQYGGLFSRYVLLAPYLGHEAPTNKPGNGNWAVAYVPRIFALTILNRLGVHGFDGLPVIAFARRPDPQEPVPTYSFRLQSNFRPHQDFRDDFRRASRPIAVLAGADDDEMAATAYAPAINLVAPGVPITVLPGLGHMAMTTAPAAIDAVAAALKP
jgi:non-heme chloroperoxidase